MWKKTISAIVIGLLLILVLIKIKTVAKEES